MLRTLPVALLCSVCVQAGAQMAEVTRYDVDQGLPQSMVNHVLQDADGFIWLGTGDGLARFDGLHFVVYKHDPRDTTSLSNSSIWGLAEADATHLWVGTRSGLDRLDRRTGRVEHVRSAGTNEKDGCWNVLRAADSKALFYSPLLCQFMVVDGHWARRLASGHRASYCLRMEAGNIVRAFVGPDSLITISLGDGRSSAQRLPVLKGETVCDVIAVRDQLLVLTLNDAWSWNERTGRHELPEGTRALFQKAPGTKHVERDPDGRLWAAITDVGLVRLGEDLSVQEEYLLLPQQERPLSITAIAFDHQGDIWVGTDGKGVFKVSPQRIHFGRVMPGMGSRWAPRSWFVRGFAQWDATHVLVAFFQGGFALFDERTQQLAPITLPAVPASANAGHLLNDKDGLVWMMVDNDVIALRPPLSDPVFRSMNDHGTMICRDALGSVVQILPNAILRYHWDGEHVATDRLGYPAMLAHLDSLQATPKAMMMDDHQRIWISSVLETLSVWGPPGRVAVTSIGGLVLNAELRMTALNLNERDRWWMTTSDGLLAWDPDSPALTQHFTTHDGAPDQFLNGLLRADDGSWWISSNNGLSHFDPRTRSFRNYGTGDGVQSKEFNTNASFRSASGRFYFGGVNGFNHFMPSAVSDDGDRPSVRLVRLLRDDLPLALPLSTDGPPLLTLSFPRNRAEIQLAVLEFTAPEHNTLRYRMDGYIDEWHTLAPDRPIVLEHVPAGDYLLEVQGFNGDGVAGPQQRILHVVVPLPFWASRWAFVLGGSVLAALIAAILFVWYRRRMQRRIQRAEAEMKVLRMRTRLAQEIHDDVGSGLARIAAVVRSPKRVEQADERFDKVSSISAELLANLRDVVWMNDPRNDELGATLLRLKDHAFDLFENSGTDVRVELPEPLPHRAIGGVFRRTLYLVGKEALQNARKYAKAKEAALAFSLVDGHFRMHVSDDGQGIPVTGGATGNGLRNMRQRAEAVGARYTLTSSPGSGTSVLLEGVIPALDE